jgi:hypothetical protein
MLSKKSFKRRVSSFLFPIIPERWKYLSKNYHNLRSLKDIHKGRRAFLIGSGPSLSISDLDKLQNEISFACNKIFLIFNDTHWRPTYYSVIDSMVAQNCAREIQQLKLKKIFSSVVKPNFSDAEDILWLRDLPSPIVDGKRQFQFSQNIAEGTYGGFTVIYTMLQLAHYMGITEIFLLGVDFNFTTPKPSEQKSRLGETLLTCEGEINHFHPDYRKSGEQWTMPQLEYQYNAFQQAKNTFQNTGRIIYNASRSTKLDVFPFADFDQIMAESK